MHFEHPAGVFFCYVTRAGHRIFAVLKWFFRSLLGLGSAWLFTREGIASLATSWLKPVSKFYDVHVHTETGRSVQAGIGEVLDPKAGIGVREWIDANSRGRDDLNRPPEVLHANL